MGRWVGGGNVDDSGGGWVDGSWLCGWCWGRGGWWVGYYNFPRSTNKIKSCDKISTPEKNYIFLHFSVVGEGQT